MGGDGNTKTHYSVIQREEKFGNSAKEMAQSQNKLPNIISNRKKMMNVIFWPQNFLVEKRIKISVTAVYTSSGNVHETLSVF